jgi:hypothetical protein
MTYSREQLSKGAVIMRFFAFSFLLGFFLTVGVIGCDSNSETFEDSPVELEKAEELTEEVEEEIFIEIEKALIKIEANPDKGFYWDYYLFVPELIISQDENIYLLVGPNNTGTVSDDIKLHDDNARYEATEGFKNIIANRLGVPLLVPVFPRPSNEWWIYTHSLDRNTLMVKEGRLARIDLQLIAMIEDAKLILTKQGLNVEEQVFMKGFSACSTFTNRFAILHPHIVKAVATGGINSIPMFPTEEWNGERLRYPVGIADIKEIAGIEFKLEEYMKVAQYIYMGSEDDNDTTLFDDAYERVDADLIWRLVGKGMDVRWENSEQIYKELGIPAQFVTYQGVGHSITPQIINDVVDFFAEYLPIDYHNRNTSSEQVFYNSSMPVVGDSSIAYIEPSMIEIGVPIMLRMVVLDSKLVSEDGYVRVSVELETDENVGTVLHNLYDYFTVTESTEHSKNFEAGLIKGQQKEDYWEGFLMVTLPEDFINMQIKASHEAQYHFEFDF